MIAPMRRTAGPSIALLVMTLLVMVAIVAGAATRAVAQGPTPGPSTVISWPTVEAWLADVARRVRLVLEDAQSPDAEPTASATADVRSMVGQKLMVRMNGARPSKALLGRIRRGEVGGIVLLGSQVSTRSALRTLTRTLQDAATTGGQPPLLIAVDQEGGAVKRLPWAPPTLSVPRMGQIGSTAIARAQGRRTGRALLDLGINVDLAPVADIPRSSRSFMFQQGRTFSFDARATARLADAFASGLADAGVLATMKHFPGIGRAIRNTDHFVEEIDASRSAMESDLRPYRRAIAHDIPLIMLSNATYSAFDPDNAAGWSRAVAVDLLRGQMGFQGVSITDSLDGTGHARGLTVRDLGLRAAVAGTDIILTTGSEKTTRRLYETLLAAAADGTIPRALLRGSNDRILALKDTLAPDD
jgi:beta-N-acetylhexosaminidase